MISAGTCRPIVRGATLPLSVLSRRSTRPPAQPSVRSKRSFTSPGGGYPLPERFEEHRVLLHAVAVVQHQHGGNRKQRGEVFEIPLREHGQAGHPLRGQKRKVLPLPRSGLFGGEAQVVEKGGAVRIRLVDLVPNAWQASGL